MPTAAYVPYCGPAPVPGALTWNLDPFLIAAFLVAAIGYARGARAVDAPRLERASFAAGWLVPVLAVVPPVCQLGIALFSARVAQHVLATLVAAPLIVWGRGGLALAGLSPRAPSRAVRSAPAGVLVAGPVLFAAALWIWHLGPPYDATLTSHATYWAMHLTLFAAALLLWWGLLRAPGAAAFPAILVALATGVQMSLLGVALAFAQGPWFAAHLATAPAWGLSPLEDQQLGGLIMWMPGMVLMVSNALLAFWIALRRLDARSPS
jgi:putative membrane protein